MTDEKQSGCTCWDARAENPDPSQHAANCPRYREYYLNKHAKPVDPRLSHAPVQERKRRTHGDKGAT